MLFLRSLLFALGYVIAVVVVSILGVLAWPLPFKFRFRVVTLLNRFVMVWIRLCCGIRFQIQGQYDASAGPYLVISKHASTWETMFLQYYFQPISTILKRELLNIPFFGWGLATLRPIAIDRGSPIKALKKVKQDGQQRLKDGTNVLVYPEGTRMPYGEKGSYARSGADIAKAAGVKIIPVAHNAGKYWPKGKFIKHPGTITVVIGEPIDTGDKTSKELMLDIEAWIENTIDSMS